MSTEAAPHAAPPAPQPSRWRFWQGIVVGLVLGAVAGVTVVAATTDAFTPQPIDAVVAPDQQVELTAATVTVAVPESAPVARGADAYAGHGAWIDVFDFDPAYQNGGQPAITLESLDEMADGGIETVYLQAARLDERTPDGLVSPLLLYQFVRRAHERGMRVVGWYLPKFGDVDADVTRVDLLDRFDVFGEQLDGIAIDIEDNATVPDPVDRSDRLVSFSQRAKELVGDDVLGAIVLPPVQIEVVNADFWPGFPYDRLADLYDVWLPMSYWTFRSADSGYLDGYTYNEESTRRLRDNLGDDDALVHGIGGIGDLATVEALDDFGRSLADTDSIGGSIYDWSTLSQEKREAMDEIFARGSASELPSP
jgi:hypothetical protein